MDVTRTVKVPNTIYTLTSTLAPGVHTLTWAPATTTNPRTFLIRISAVDRGGNRVVYGAANASSAAHRRASSSASRGSTRASASRAIAGAGRAHPHRDRCSGPDDRVFRSGPEQVVTYADNQMAGVDVGLPPTAIDWRSTATRRARSASASRTWPSGLYYAQFDAADGRVGYAPFVVRPRRARATGRVARRPAHEHLAGVQLPGRRRQRVRRHVVRRTAEPGRRPGHARTSRVGHRRASTATTSRSCTGCSGPERRAEFISDSDFDTIASGDDLARAYDLVVFEGHEEYVTTHEYDVVTRFRDLGGNLMFLSANNFFWKVDKQGQVLRKITQWRQIGRPGGGTDGRAVPRERRRPAAGAVHGPASAGAPWLWDGTGLVDGATFGQFVGGYGIEIDSTTPDSPPGTLVLAQIPDLFGPGISAQMTYYETVAGAKVFSAGTLDFGGSSTFWPVKRMLDNLWARLSKP